MTNRLPPPAHAPGPWLLRPSGEIVAQAWLGKRDDYICRMPISSLAEAAEMGPAQMGNAHLIVAAPLLLQRCKMALIDAEEALAHPERASTYNWRSIAYDLREVIAAAEGRTTD
jgi:hypothetical protein